MSLSAPKRITKNPFSVEDNRIDFFYNLDRHKIAYNPENVVVLVDKILPIELLFITSLGRKFAYAPRASDFPIINGLICLEEIVERLATWQLYGGFFREKKRIANEIISEDFINNNENDNRNTIAQEFILKCLSKALKFLKNNKELVVLPADKGGKMVILDVDGYERRARDHLNKGLLEGVYFISPMLTEQYARDLVEKKYSDLMVALNPHFKEDIETGKFGCIYELHWEPFVMPRFAGTVKLEKDGQPLRPIVSSINKIGKNLENWLLSKLELIAVKHRTYQVRDGKNVYDNLTGLRLKDGHVLGIYDYSNMFTNISYMDAIE